jgi:GH15 family glucan-1,4-alpha-glucosidase
MFIGAERPGRVARRLWSRWRAVIEHVGLFEQLVGLSNDLGLLAEEYDVAHGRQVGNFPQALAT